MPKKTKKQKLLAQKRREKIAIEPIPTIVSATSYSLSPSAVIRKETVGTAQNHLISDGQPVIFDIWNIIVLSLLAFSFEIGVYWFLHRGF